MNTRKLLLLIYLLFLMVAVGSQKKSSEKKIEKPKEEQIHTHPAPYFHKRTRMIANGPMIVAVIDTGMTVSSKNKAKLCKTGHKDFTSLRRTVFTYDTEDPVPTDEHGHGTNIAGIITRLAGDTDYCLVILKYWNPINSKENVLEAEIKAIKYANEIGAKIINISGGGTEFSSTEQDVVKEFLDSKGILVAAAGNEGKDLNKEPFYPALSDTRVIAVGSKCGNDRAPSSNYGNLVTAWENGCNVFGFGISLSGTSQAAAVHTGKLIKKMLDNVSK